MRYDSSSREPVKATCPDIDLIIETLEKLRESNHLLRNWGYEESKRVDELESENEDLRDKVNELEDVIEDLKLEIINAQA